MSQSISIHLHTHCDNNGNGNNSNNSCTCSCWHPQWQQQLQLQLLMWWQGGNNMTRRDWSPCRIVFSVQRHSREEASSLLCRKVEATATATATTAASAVANSGDDTHYGNNSCRCFRRTTRPMQWGADLLIALFYKFQRDEEISTSLSHFLLIFVIYLLNIINLIILLANPQILRNPVETHIHRSCMHIALVNILL